MKKLAKSIIIVLSICYGCTGQNNKKVSDDVGGMTEKFSKTFVATDNTKSLTFSTTEMSAGGSECSDILSQGIMREYKLTSKHDYELAIKKALTMTDDEIRQSSTSHDGSAEIGLKILSFGADYSDKDDQFNSIKKKYSDNSTLDLSRNDLLEVERRIADPLIVKAWLACMGSGKDGITYKINGDLKKEFSVQIRYVPVSAYDPKQLSISNVTLTGGIVPAGTKVLNKGTKITQFTSVTQKFKRTALGVASISIDSRLGPLNIYLDKIPSPTVPQDSVEVWLDRDESGTLYTQYFITQTPDCNGCGDDHKQTWSKIETLNNRQGVIYKVERDCQGAGCGWNFSTNPIPYGIVYHVLADPSQFWFERISGGPSCTEINIAYYKVKKKVPKNSRILGGV